MRQKLFVLVMVLLFAAFTSGGCESSSHNSLADTQQTSQSVESYVKDSEMASVMNSPEFAAMWEELDEEGVFEQIGDWYLMFNVSQEIQDRILGELSGDRRDRMARSFFSADLVNEKYKAGEVVVIAYPDEEIINKVLEAAGQKPNYKMNEEDKNGRLEVYAIAKKTTYGRNVLSTYTVPCSVNFDDDTETLHKDPGPVSGLVDSGDVDSGDVDSGDITSEPKQTVTPRIMSNKDFQVDRWRRFFLWCAGLDDESIEASAYADSEEFQAAAWDIKKVAEVQRETFDLSYCDYNGARCKWFDDTDAFQIIYNRTNELTYTVYAAHSIDDGYDYYFIRSYIRTIPNGFIDEYVDYSATKFNWVSGYTRSVSAIHYMANDSDGGKTGSDVVVADALPTLSEGEHLDNGRHEMSYILPDPVYVKYAIGSEEFDTVTYSDSLYWNPPTSTNKQGKTTTDYYMIRDGDEEEYSERPSTIGWCVVMSWPFWSSTTKFTAINERYNIRARPDSISEFTYNTDWVWKVSSSYRNNGGDKYLNINASFEDGASRSGMKLRMVTWDWYDNSKARSFSRKFRLYEPPLEYVEIYDYEMVNVVN